MRKTLLITALTMIAFVATADAHFRLNSPASLSAQSAPYGDPQKTEPCGPTNPVTPNGEVTEVQAGSMYPISITETIDHPGHYRVALAQDMAGLPPAPNVADPNCNGLVPNANPTLPVLADGLLAHTASLGKVPRTMMVPIPAGMTCTNCILQVVEYMAQHAPKCFYYHCARVNISPNAPPPPPPGDGGIDPTPDGGGDGPAEPSGGCNAGGDGAPAGLLGMFLVGLLALRRRRS